MTRRGEELEEHLLGFAARIGKVVDAFPDTRMGRHVAGQLVRSGTSPAPNYAEACSLKQFSCVTSWPNQSSPPKLAAA